MRRSSKSKKRRSSSNYYVSMIILAVILIGAISFYMKRDERNVVAGTDSIAEQVTDSTGINSGDGSPVEEDHIESNSDHDDEDEQEEHSDQGGQGDFNIEDYEEEEEEEEHTDPSVQQEPDADIESFDIDIHPVFYAIKINDLLLLQALINGEEDITATIGDSVNSDIVGFNAFHYAAYKLNIEAMEHLLNDPSGRFGVNGYTSASVETGMAALHIVSYRSEEFPREAVLAADYLLKREGIEINSIDGKKMTPALIAVDILNLDLLNLLITFQFDPKYRNEDTNDNILHVAMDKCSRPIIKTLMAYAPPEVVHGVNNFNREPIHEAAANNCVDGLKELILVHRVDKHTLSPSRSAGMFTCRTRETCFRAPPLHFAAKFRKFEAVEFLLLIQAKLKFKDELGKPAQDYSGAGGMPIYDYLLGREEYEEQMPPNGYAEGEIRMVDRRPLEEQSECYEIYRDRYLHPL